MVTCCCNCGRPVEQYYLTHDLGDREKDDLAKEGWRFGCHRLIVIRCPHCPPGPPSSRAKRRASDIEVMYYAMNNDIDGLASYLDDLGNCDPDLK